MDSRCIIFLLLLIMACATAPEKESYLEEFQRENHLDYEDKYHLVEKETFSLGLDSETNYYGMGTQLKKNKAGEWEYIYMNSVPQTIHRHSLKERLHQIIPLRIEGPDGIGEIGITGRLTYINHKEIYLYNAKNGYLFKLNEKGEVLEKWYLVDFQNNSEPVPSTMSRAAFKIGDYLYMTCQLDERPLSLKGYGMVMKLNLKTGKKTYIIPFPDKYDDAFWGTHFEHQVFIDYLPNKKCIVASFPMSHYVYLYDLDGKLLSKKYVGCTKAELLEPQGEDPELYYRLNESEFFYEAQDKSKTTSKYSRIIYDETNGLIYRVFKIAKDLDAIKMGDYLSDFCLVIMDEDLNKVGEQCFDGKKYTDGISHAMDGQIITYRKDLYQQNEDEITFSVFDIETKLN